MPFTTQFSSKTLENLNVLKTLGCVNLTTSNSTTIDSQHDRDANNPQTQRQQKLFYNSNSINLR